MEGMDKFRTARALQLAELSAGVTIGAGGGSARFPLWGVTSAPLSSSTGPV